MKCTIQVLSKQGETVYPVSRWLPGLSGSVHGHRALVLEHLDSRQDRLVPHGWLLLVWLRFWKVHRGRWGVLCFGRRRGAGFRVHRNRVILLRFVAFLLRCWSLVVGRSLGGWVRGAGRRRVCTQVRILVIVQVRPWCWRIIVTDRCRTRWFTVTGPSVKSLLRWGLVVAEGGGVVGVRAVPVWQTGIVALRIGSRERLVVGVPLLLVVVRHAVLEGGVRVIVVILWFSVTTSAADSTAADIIATGGVVVISVRLLVRVIPLVVGHRLHTVTGSPYGVCAVWILLKHLLEKDTTKDQVKTCTGSTNI